MSHGKGAFYERELTSECLPPELYEGKAEGFLSSQFQIGSILYKVVTGYHPCRHLSLEDAYNYTAAMPAYAFSEFRSDLPHSYREFLHKMMHSLPSHRYPDAKTLKSALDVVSLDFPLV